MGWTEDPQQQKGINEKENCFLPEEQHKWMKPLSSFHVSFYTWLMTREMLTENAPELSAL